jgi:hypothetical protein
VPRDGADKDERIAQRRSLMIHPLPQPVCAPELQELLRLP